jgi:hypothetical protein
MHGFRGALASNGEAGLSAYRMLKEVSGRFFEKKRRKKLLIIWTVLLKPPLTRSIEKKILSADYTDERR